MRRWSKPATAVGVVLVAFAATLAVGSGHSVFSSPAPTMRMDPESFKIEGTAGATFTIDIVIEDIVNLSSFKFELRFDDKRSSLVEIAEGPFLGSEGAETACTQSGPLPGISRFLCSIQEGNGGPDGSGVIAELTFSLIYPLDGMLEFSLLACEAVDGDLEPIVLNGCKDAMLTANLPPTPTLPPLGGIGALPEVAGLATDAGGSSRTGSVLWTVGTALALIGAAAVARYTARRLSA